MELVTVGETEQAEVPISKELTEPRALHRRGDRLVLKATPVFVAVVACSVLLLGATTGLRLLQPQAASAQGAMLWQDPANELSCDGNFTIQAIQLSDYPGGPGCSQTWFVFIPSHEGGNVTSELAFISSHHVDGIIMDDFAPDSYQLYASLSGAAPVCALVYAGAEQPPITRGGCVILSIPPSYGYTRAVLDQEVSRIRASRLYLLAYGAPFSGWPSPIPRAYLSAMGKAAAGTTGGLIVWH